MNDIAIQVRGLGKQYKIGAQREKYKTLRDTIAGSVKSLGRGGGRKNHETFWALRDISFDVQRGEVVGVVGRNGAGKSTLLKVLSRITEPTEGYAEIHGRVGSLLEVGTGFHPELSGRENVFLSGAILGMRRSEILNKFDEIVEFAEVEKFIDTPVKHYSSGMYLRLAFAVAAHLEPEILVVDEVLAVGDATFQNKCMGKMGDVSKQGRTVLFVSHNMTAVKRLCSRGVLLKAGGVEMQGDVNEVVAAYEAQALAMPGNVADIFPVISEEYGLVLENADVQTTLDGEHTKLKIQLWLKTAEALSRVGIAMIISTFDGTPIARLAPRVTGNVIDEVNGRCCCTLECGEIERYLASGEYLVSFSIALRHTGRALFAENAARFLVPPSDLFGTGAAFEGHIHGVVPLPILITDVQPL